MKPWTTDEARFLREHYDENTVYDVARKLGRSSGSVRGMARRMGLRKHHLPERIREQAQRIGCRFSLREMRAMLPDAHPNTVATGIGRLVARGELRKDGTEYWA